MNPIESVPTAWDDERDTAFFRIVAALFDPAFCLGAGVLLASADPQTDDRLLVVV